MSNLAGTWANAQSLIGNGHKPVTEPSGEVQGDLDASRKDALKALAKAAERIYLDREIAPMERLVHLRDVASDLDLRLRDGELQRFIWDVRRRLNGISDGYGPDDHIETPDDQWLHQGLLLAEDSNLIVGLPKANKTTYVLGTLEAIYKGQSQFLGRNLMADLPPIFIAGPDQPGHIWQLMLKRSGFVNEDGKRSQHIVKLYSRERPIHLTPDGIEKMAQAAEDNPGLIFLLDSYHTLIRPLDLEENSPSFADPFIDFLEAVAPFKATVLCIHHANKASAGRSATFTSRGSTAHPGAASQTLDVSRLKPDDIHDNRRIIFTEGRLAEPVKLLATFNGDQGWTGHGDATAVEQAEGLEEAIEKLNDRQYAALEHLRERWALGHEISQADLEGLDDFRKVTRNNRIRSLDQLVTKGLATSREVATDSGRLKLFQPVEISMSHPTETSGVSVKAEITELCETSHTTTEMSQVTRISRVLQTPQTPESGETTPKSNLPDWAEPPPDAFCPEF